MLCIQTIVLKIGSAVLTNENKSINDEVLTHLAEQIATLYKEGHRIILVTSGAVASGKGIVDLTGEKSRLVRKQMYAGLGQAILMHKYQNIFAKHRIPIAQCLITRDNFADRAEYKNLINTLEGYLKYRVLPILNENDIVANTEVNFGGNDFLASLVAISIRADKFIILSDIDALYDKDPQKNPDAKAIHLVEKITPQIEKMCGGSSSTLGLGGMISKVQAIKMASESGIRTFLGKGISPNILHDLVDTKNPVGTYFKAQKGKTNRFKHWLKYCSLPKGTISIDDGAVKAINEGKSLLMVGIKELSDGIEKNDTVYIVDLHNQPVGTGRIDYSSEEIKEAMSSGKNLEVVIHCDNLSVA